MRFGLLVGILVIVASTTLAGDASAACVGNTCSLGGQLRWQSGLGLPRPLSLAPAPDGDLRWGQPGLIQATPSATVQQGSAGPGTPGTDPRSLMFVKPGLFSYDEPLVSVDVIKDDIKIFAIHTNLEFQFPHPGTTGSGATAEDGPFSTQMLSAGGRTGPAVVSWCAGLPPPTASYNPGCAAPDNFGFFTVTTYGANTNQPASNGLVRYTATRNQFGGTIRARKNGTSVVFYNAAELTTGELPCTIATNPHCIVARFTFTPPTQSVVGSAVGAMVTYSGFAQPTAIFDASIGASGTIHSVGPPVTDGMGRPIYGTFTTAHTSWGFPGTTGRLTISVTQNRGAPTELETFTRTGGDNRTAGGEGIVVLVSGALSNRSIIGPNAVRGWATFNVPEPSAIAAASAGYLALVGCQQWVRRRGRSSNSAPRQRDPTHDVKRSE